jgi:AraC-like DNA-binding protein
MIRTKNSVFEYLVVSELDKIWGLFVTGSGSADIASESPYPPTKHPDAYMFNWENGRILTEFQILYITRGTGIFESRAVGRKKITEGSILLLFPETWHRYMPEKKTGWREHWISFNGPQVKNFLERGIISPNNPVIDIGLKEDIISLYQEVLELIQSEKIGYKEIIASLTYQIIAKVYAAERSKKYGGKEVEQTIIKAKAFMADRVDKKLCIEDLAEELGIGYSWFRRMFKHYTSFAPAQYFLELKLNKAKDLLTNTSLSVKEIAVITGFESQFYFSKLFKKKMKISPIQLREYSRGKKQKP